MQETFYEGFVHSKNCFKQSFVRLRRRRESVPVIFPSLVVTERQKTSQTKVSKASSLSPTHSKVNQHGGDKSFENMLSSSLKGVTSRFLQKRCSYIRSRVSLKVKFFTGCLETLAKTGRIKLTFPLMTLASWFCICVDCCGASSPWPLL